MPTFSHLHCHTQYSLLDGAASIKKMIGKAKTDGQPAVAITDHGNMLGVFQFVAEADKQGIKAVAGCEFYLVANRHQKVFGAGLRDVRYHQLLLAKNATGYQNLCKLSSIGFIEGYYSKYPRIDKELIEKYHEGLIATSCCIGASIPQAIINKSEEEAEQELKWWLNIFGDDFYIELQRHGLENLDGSGKSQEDVNQVLIKFARKYNLKIIATNDSHYIDQKDFDAHDILLCINTGEKKSTPIGDGKGYRFGFPNDQFFFKTTEQMSALFADIPEAIDNTNQLIDKVEKLKLKRDVLMPLFEVPNGFNSQADYLRHLTYQGAQSKYKEITPEVKERLDLELNIIDKMGFPGYFLIVQDFIKAARDLGVAVGPGRGSAAGSAVAFCTGITNVDPIKYNLLFERFLNPERVSMPDIDVDFDDEGREKVFDYVIKKYGEKQVAQIITYGTMGAKTSIKDVARVLDLPLDQSNALSKLIPETPGVKLSVHQLLEAPLYRNPELTEDDDPSLEVKGKLTPDEIAGVIQLRDIYKANDVQSDIIKMAEILDGSVRNTGVHAAGVIIAPDDITNYVPVARAKDSELYVVQYDGKYIESAGMLKMDFLGLKTLTIIKKAIQLIKIRHGIEINPDDIPLDDVLTLELFQKGDTVAIFQFESEGMRMYLKALKPTHIEEIIAMNALYRPGPMDYIDSFVARKHGREKIEYPHPALEEILKPTYGIMVYQEQIMQAAQILGGYSLGGADLLRRAMGKKDKNEMQKQRLKFVEGAKEKHNLDEARASEIFDIMAKFAGYGFNRSHAAAYSVVAFQTAYFKAHYPAEFMAAVLSNNMSDIKKVQFFIEEAKHVGVKTLGPDINESFEQFSVNKAGNIRFGIGAVKGVGESAVSAIIDERLANGPFTSPDDFVSRVNLRTVNKRVIESLVNSGAFDSFEGINRAQYTFVPQGQNKNYIEQLLDYASSVERTKNSAQASLFGEAGDISTITVPIPPKAEVLNELSLLKIERELVGMYISGHPLDPYKYEVEAFCNYNLSNIPQTETSGDIFVAGVITSFSERVTKKGEKYCEFTIEDFEGQLKITLFSRQYAENQFLIYELSRVYIKGRMERRFNGELQFRVLEMKLLDEIRNEKVKAVELKINFNQFSPNGLEKLFENITANKGKCRVYVSFELNNLLSSGANEIFNYRFGSKSFFVNPTNDFIEQVERIPGLEIKLLAN